MFHSLCSCLCRGCQIKEEELVFKELLVDKMSNVHNNIDLLDELTRLKLGYSGKDEIVISLE